MRGRSERKSKGERNVKGEDKRKIKGEESVGGGNKRTGNTDCTCHFPPFFVGVKLSGRRVSEYSERVNVLKSETSSGVVT